MQQVEYLNQWDINEEEHLLFGTRKDITAVEENIEQVKLKEVNDIQGLANREKQIKKDQVVLKK